ncbi:MAG: hypothetical protein FJ298_09545 [Planctomycetes bacterium]|nr:hypothetical protein [Planctomycetota bacterium]
MSATAPSSALARDLRLLGVAFAFELRKVTAWRAGFVVRELMRSLWRPLVMIFVYRAILATSDARIGGFDFPTMVAYLILAASFEKLLFHQRGLDLADQIFQGYVTKYLTMPVRFFVLALGRFAQHLAVQSSVIAGLWAVGSLLFPQWWPRAASASAAVEAFALVLLGSYCAFLVCFLVNVLAFWLEVVWTLSAMASFVFSFAAGVLVPVSAMPESLAGALRWLFPYWAVSAPGELFLGRLGTQEFVRGVCVLLSWIVALELTREFLWRRGLHRHVGAGA